MLCLVGRSLESRRLFRDSLLTKVTSSDNKKDEQKKEPEQPKPQVRTPREKIRNRRVVVSFYK